MENNFNDPFVNDLAAPPERPQFLKVLCILSFVWCGIMILVYLVGSFCLAMSDETKNMIIEKVSESNPNVKIENAAEFINQIGQVSLLCLLANIASLVGVIMMWNFNKIGFFIYAIAELSTNFFGLNINAGTEGDKSYGMMIVTILIDIVFIAMYAIHLKYMKKTIPVS
ncbi:MAG: hypothetical protein JWO32_346 [Bacteroidetes bacterium]|nr:hypothetical protein [Bacteroidota bacterium]